MSGGRVSGLGSRIQGNEGLRVTRRGQGLLSP